MQKTSCHSVGLYTRGACRRTLCRHQEGGDQDFAEVAGNVAGSKTDSVLKTESVFTLSAARNSDAHPHQDGAYYVNATWDVVLGRGEIK